MNVYENIGEFDQKGKLICRKPIKVNIFIPFSANYKILVIHSFMKKKVFMIFFLHDLVT